MYLVSNTQTSPGQPCYQEAVSPLDRRESQWRRIVAAKVAGNTCNVFNNQDQYRASAYACTNSLSLN